MDHKYTAKRSDKLCFQNKCINFLYYFIYNKFFIKYVIFYLSILFQQYSYNRRGQCEVNIEITFNSVGRLKSTFVRLIHFDTSLTKRQFSNLQRGNSCTIYIGIPIHYIISLYTYL